MNNNNLKLKNTKNIQRGCQNVPLFIFHFSLNARSLTLLILALSMFVFLYSAQSIDAAVPVWVVGFDNNTDYEKSLEVFLFNLMQAIQERNEDFQMSFKLAQIEKAREDVNKLMYEAFTELRSEPLLLEFQRIKQACSSKSSLPSGNLSVGRLAAPNTNPSGSDPTFLQREACNNKNSGDKCDYLGQIGICRLIGLNQTGLYCDISGGNNSNTNNDPQVCQFISQVENFLKGRGLTIVKSAVMRDQYGSPIYNFEEGADPLCINGVVTDDGECITIKLEGRIITNPDDFIFEEPAQKARDFVMCYLGPWRHFPFANKEQVTPENCRKNNIPQEQCSVRALSAIKRDQMKAAFLFQIARKLKYTEISPPEQWYTEARCEKILARLECPDILGYEKTAPIGGGRIIANRSQACSYKAINNMATLAEAPGKESLLVDLVEAATRAENTFAGVWNKVQENIDKIIQDYEKLRIAQYIAGQGIRPEKYLIGYQSYTPEEYEKLKKAWEQGGTFEHEEGPPPVRGATTISPLAEVEQVNPTGDWYYYDTEDIISPAVILLNKIAAATQAEFDMARDAFKVRPSQENIAYIERDITNEPGFVAGRLGADRRWISVNFESNNTNRVQNPPTSVKTFGPGLGPTMGGLLAPFEDTGLKLDESYLNKDNPPWIEGNYFSQWYKDILQLHNYNFGTIVKDWFGKPEKAYFIPDR